MISHQIIKKPRIKVNADGSSTSLVLVETSPIKHMVASIMNNQRGTPGVLSEVGLLNYIDSHNFGVGNYVKFKHMSIADRHGIHVIIGCQTKHMNVSLDRHGEPNCFYMAKAFPVNNFNWERWDSGHDYTTLTDEELRDLILPEHDILQNRIQELQQKFLQMQATGTAK
jgi:hypothetical protein